MRTTPQTSSRRWGQTILACAVMLGAAASVRAADQIEERLPGEAFKLVKYLKKNGYQNVGVLKFRVQKGNERETFHAGPLNIAMATRLENALLLMNDKTNPVGIIHDANGVAASKKEKATYTDPKGREKLFRYEYPLAWGKKMVSPDAFLTGIVQVNFVKRTATVTIEAISRTEKKPTPVTSFEVRTDRTILTDVCTNFVLNSRGIRTMSQDEAEKKANDKAKDPDTKKGQPEDRLVDLEILYDGNRQEEMPSEVHPDAKQVPEPQEGNKLVLRIKNISNRRVAALVAVNGKNTLYQEELTQISEGGNGTKWVLEPDAQIDLHGFYRNDDKMYDPFTVLSKEDSAKEEELDPNPNLGAIHLIVFQEGDWDSPMLKTQGLRKLLPLAKAQPRSAKETAKLVFDLKGDIKTAGIVKPDTNAKEANLKTVPFKDPKWQETRVIWYYYKKGSGN